LLGVAAPLLLLLGVAAARLRGRAGPIVAAAGRSAALRRGLWR